MSIVHWLLVILTLAVLAAFGVLLSVTWIESRQSGQLDGMQPYKPITSSSSRTVVVYFSRSGNTALAARHVATRLDARLYALEASDYRLGLGGLAHALRDANRLKTDPDALPKISPSVIDLTPFETIWIGSPVWLYSPAPPIWAFVENNRFDGMHVVLFNTFNSHFGDEHIRTLKAKVMARGAASFEHQHVLRGRMTQQLSASGMLQAIDNEWFGPQSSQ